MTLRDICTLEFAQHIKLFTSHNLLFSFRFCNSHTLILIYTNHLPFNPCKLPHFNTVGFNEYFETCTISLSFIPSDTIQLELNKYLDFAQLKNEYYVDCDFRENS